MISYQFLLVLLVSFVRSQNDFCPEKRIAYLPHYSNCSMFFECDDGVKILMSCVNGYTWKISVNECVNQENEDCSYTTLSPATTTTTQNPDEVCPSRGTSFLPHFADCQQYYECDDGVKTLKNCPKGQAWSIVLNTCDFKNHVDCSYTTVGPATISPDNDTCPETGISYLANFENCSSFYECREGKRTKKTCPDDYGWDINLEACVKDGDVDCSYTTVIPGITTDGWTPDPLCPYPSSISTYFPDPYNCSEFFECKNGIKVKLACEEGYKWDINGGCVPEDQADCSFTSIKPSSTESTITTKSPIPPPSGLCNNQPNGTLISDPNDCTKYIECSRGMELIYPCPTGTSWSENKKTCNTDNDANCQDMPTPITTARTTSPSDMTTAPVPPPSGLCKSQPDETLLVHPYDCTRYIECIGGIEIVYPCPNGKTWDENEKICNTNNEENCKDMSTPITQITTPHTTSTSAGPPTPSPNSACKSQADGTFLPYSGDCTRFIMCESGVEIIYACATGTSWNGNKKACDDNNAENCKDNSTTTARPTESTPNPTSSTTRPTGITMPPGPTPNPSSGCKGQSNGAFLPYPGNCNRFIVCEDEVEIIYQCATGTSWNTNKNACDTNNDENCKNDVSTSTTPTGPTANPTGTTKPTPTRTPRPTGTTGPIPTIVPPDPNTCKNQPDGTLLPYPNDNHKYIECISGIAVIYPCPNGSSWDSNSKSCGSSIYKTKFK